ncbi:MAG: AAA family ATPase [Saccharofermentans sp.]|nr:AAA family ATPase [Saccharofermentans sp.]
MRYYDFTLKTNAEKIKANTKVRLQDYCYDSPVAAVNVLVQKNTFTDMAFFIYTVEGETAYASFAFDEQKYTYQYVFGTICDLLSANFCIELGKSDPEEITMSQYLDNFLEGKRHDYYQGYSHIVDSSHLWLYYYRDEDERKLNFDMEESIAPLNLGDLDIYDDSFRNELSNINVHKLETVQNTNMAHYIITGNSRQAENRLVETLVCNLYRANRLSSRRIVFISEAKPPYFEKDYHVESLIENNYGGTVVFDLSARFGHSSTSYQLACEYITKLFRKHCNHCLFIFTYNKNDTGYSFYLLPEITKSAVTVTLDEGTGSRKAAVSYLKSLIKESEYRSNAKYAQEFFKQYKDDQFTQTDVLEAFERFGPWCINKSLNGAYGFDPSKEYVSARDGDTETSLEKLNKLIGLDIVKKQIYNIIASDIVEKERKKHMGRNYQSISSHMIFAGNPGTAKTTVAQLFAGIAKEKGVLKSGVFVERGGMDLNGPFCVDAIRDAFLAAKGGVLFIDEAYSLVNPIAVATLIQEMENHRDSVIVILAGYNDSMLSFLDLNEGLKSRVPHWVDFPDYSTEELTAIFNLMLSERNLTATEPAVKAAELIFDRMRMIKDFGNGRYVRNLIDRALLNQSSRLLTAYSTSDAIPGDELYLITKDDISSLHDGLQETRETGKAKEELDAMIGLESAKSILNKAISKYKVDKRCMDLGVPRTRGAMHMVFTGNPGTAKTTVARLCAEILNDEKILPTGKFVEAGRADLVSDHVGGTAIKVKKKFSEAQGGVLFIDEAYSLCDHFNGSYGDEAINTIVQEMENHREDTVVIFAGYPEPMKEFLDRNPGMKSRIAFNVHFEDYNTEELCKITELMVSKKQLTLTDAAMDKLRKNFDAARVHDDYGNGRYVRKLLEEAEMNQANRMITLPIDELTAEELTTIDACDIPDFVPENKAKTRIGFAC